VRVADPNVLLRMLEREWDAYLFGANKGVAALLGWRSYHTLKSKGSAPGYPDRTVCRERVLFVETKTEKGVVSEHQVSWLDALARAGAECYVWRPSDLDDAGQVLGLRWGFFPATDDRPPHLGHYEKGAWTPGSMWVPGVGRAELLGSAV
jgi:hypothetical protein